ncbi:hypothetical protein AB0E69_38955 [Kribbella sp. NPDC026611]|uniref:hypothetical protein n=1 Tax=Kribbella sp. NPDC026611 TaxID=3154911 RepID=UPI0033F0AED9
MGKLRWLWLVGGLGLSLVGCLVLSVMLSLLLLADRLLVARLGPLAGISFLMAWAAPVVNPFLEHRPVLPSVAAYAGVLGLVLVGGGVRLALAPQVQDLVRDAGVSVSQAAEARKPELGSNREGFEALNADLFAQTRREASAGAQIVAWPEAAAAVLGPDYPTFLTRAEEVARDNHIYLDVGVAVMLSGSRDLAVLLSPEGKVLSTYDKAHPVWSAVN